MPKFKEYFPKICHKSYIKKLFKEQRLILSKLLGQPIIIKYNCISFESNENTQRQSTRYVHKFVDCF